MLSGSARPRTVGKSSLSNCHPPSSTEPGGDLGQREPTGTMGLPRPLRNAPLCRCRNIPSAASTVRSDYPPESNARKAGRPYDMTKPNHISRVWNIIEKARVGMGRAVERGGCGFEIRQGAIDRRETQSRRESQSHRANALKLFESSFSAKIFSGIGPYHGYTKSFLRENNDDGRRMGNGLGNGWVRRDWRACDHSGRPGYRCPCVPSPKLVTRIRRKRTYRSEPIGYCIKWPAFPRNPITDFCTVLAR